MFSHLHVHTEYSIMDGNGKVSDWINRAKDLGQNAIAFTEHGNLNSTCILLNTCKEIGVKAIVGLEAYIVPDLSIKENNEYRNHITLLAFNNQGYHNLIKISSLGHEIGFYSKPRIDFELLKKYSEGLICLSGCCAGTLFQLIKNNKIEDTRNEIKKYQKLFGENYYIELMFFPYKSFIETYKKLYLFAKEMEQQFVITNDCHYIKKEDNVLRNIIQAIGRKKLLSEIEKERDFDCIWLKSEQEIKEEWNKNYKDTISELNYGLMLKNIQKIVDKIEDYKIDKSHKYPAIKNKYNDVIQPEELRKIIIEKVKVKIRKIINLQDNPIIWKEKYLNTYVLRAKYELDILQKKVMLPYFLVISDMVEYAKSKNILIGYGRGSVAGSLIAYCLDITLVDPIKHNILFERFISEFDESLPDIDMDFDSRCKDEIKNYIIEKYGSKNVVEISAYGIMKLKSAIKDVARTMGCDYQIINELTKNIDYEREYSQEELVELLGENKNSETNKKIIEYASKLDGQVRHLSLHPAGIVITPKDTTDYIPVQRYDNKIITGWTEGVYRRELSDLGIVKYDILGLNTLSYVKDCLDLIEKKYNKKIDMENIDLKNEKVFEMFNRGLMFGVFQFDSRTMIPLVKEMSPSKFEDLVALLAIDRPAILSNGIQKIIFENKKLGISRTYNEKTKEILKNTYGVMLFQDQVLIIAKEIAGLNAEDRYFIRKLIKKVPQGKEKEAFLQKAEPLRKKFEEGCVKNGTNENIANKMWNDILAFGGYGFNFCISGDTIVEKCSGNQYEGKFITIKQLYERKYGENYKNTYVQSKYNLEGFPQILSLYPDKTIKPQKIKDIYFNGVKKVYKINLKNGYNIKATLEHRILSLSGWRQIKELKIGDKIIIGAKRQHVKHPENMYGRLNTKGKHYVGRGFPVGKNNPAFINGKVKSFRIVKKLKENIIYCEKCKAPLVGKFEFHHVDGNRLNNNFTNFLKLCNSCHKKEDYILGKRKIRWSVGKTINCSEIISIKYCGLENTYDIEMEKHHNYLANNFISHNSHAVSYALLSYLTMYLKVTYPIEFFISYLNNTGDVEDIQSCRGELRKFNIKLLPVDINKSKEYFVEEGGNIRYGFKFLKNINNCEEIVNQQPYSSFEEFSFKHKTNKQKVNSRVINSLIKSGAFDKFGIIENILALNDKFSNKKKKKEDTEKVYTKFSCQLDSYGYIFDLDIPEYKSLDEIIGSRESSKVEFYAIVKRVYDSGKTFFININFKGVESSICIFDHEEVPKFAPGNIILIKAIIKNYKGKKGFICKVGDIKILY